MFQLCILLVSCEYIYVLKIKSHDLEFKKSSWKVGLLKQQRMKKLNQFEVNYGVNTCWEGLYKNVRPYKVSAVTS